MNQTQPVSAENANTDTVSEAKPKTNVIRGSFSNIDAEYQVIGNIISELANLGFHLVGINTSGENSGHDWTVAYKKAIYLLMNFPSMQRVTIRKLVQSKTPAVLIWIGIPPAFY